MYVESEENRIPRGYHRAQWDRNGEGKGRRSTQLARCYESPKKKLISHAFEYLIYNLKTYNGVEI